MRYNIYTKETNRKRVNSRVNKPVTLRPVIRATPTTVRVCTLLGLQLICGYRITAIMIAFQAIDEGSAPSTRSRTQIGLALPYESM